MTHVITQSCCNDAACVYACPVNCIQPTPDSPDFLLVEMLSIDPATCVDCGACVAACPVGAIKPQSKLTDDELIFQGINEAMFGKPRARPPLAPVPPPLEVRGDRRPLRVAIVGSGPAAMYAADEVLTIPGARVHMYERLPVPYGLARFGVAPDHRRTRQITRQLDLIASQPRLHLETGVEVGVDVTHEELLARHDAVIYAVGAPSDRRVDVPGIDLPGTGTATEFVAWYNGHPEYADRTYDLSHPTAVVIGNGNVALDVARILTVDPDALFDTDIAPGALEALRRSRIEEVIVIGRRGPAEASFTLPELAGLRSTPGVELVISADDLADGGAATAKTSLLAELGPSQGGARRITLCFFSTPKLVLGEARAEGIEVARSGSRERIAAGLVLTSIGYRGRPVPGLPFDEPTGTVPNERGRVVDSPGAYVAGWIKRGPTGFIGTNRSCAQETVATLVDDHNAGLLPAGARLKVGAG